MGRLGSLIEQLKRWISRYRLALNYPDARDRRRNGKMIDAGRLTFRKQTALGRIRRRMVASVLLPGWACEVVFSTECSKMTLSIDGLQDGVRSKTVYRPTADLKRRISTLKRLITDCDRIAADLDQEIQREEDRVRIHDRAHFAYSTYARATTSRRDNLRRSAEELRAHLAKAQKALRESPIL